MRLAALLTALLVAGPSPTAVPATDGQVAIEIGSALARNDWSTVTKLVAIQDIGQNETAPLFGPDALASPAALSAYLSTCGFIAMATDFKSGPGVDLERNKVSTPSTLQVAWLCPRLNSATAHVSKIDGRFRIKFEKQNAPDGYVEELNRSNDNRRLLEALQKGSIADGKFDLGSRLKAEARRPGEPTDAELSQAALKYFADIAAIGEATNNRGLDYIDLTRMSWDDKGSSRFQPLSFEEVRQRLRSCRAQSGWPRRFERNGERVCAFDSLWVCLGTSGPYVFSVFLEITNGQVSGGRILN